MRKTSLFVLFVCFSIVMSLLGTSVSPSAAANESESDDETTLSQSVSPQLEANYVKAAVKAKKLYVIRLSDMSETESAMIASLQGLLANKSSNQIYILPDSGNYKIWLDDLVQKYGVKTEFIHDPWKLVKEFKKQFDGYLLWEKGNSSINAATSLAHLKQAILIEKGDVNQAKSYKQLMDLSTKDEAWVKQNYWNKLNHRTLIEQKGETSEELASGMGGKLRDYAVMANAFTFYDGNSAFRQSVVADADPDAVILGWGDASKGEDAFIRPSSTAGVYTLPADHAYNLSVLSSFNIKEFKQKDQTQPSVQDNMHYVSFVMSDGDNIQWMLNDLADKGKPWFGNPNRGNFDMGWAVSPSMMDLAPTVLERFYQDGTKKDNFVVGPSGGGYMYPSMYPEQELDAHLKQLNADMGRADLSIVEVIDFNAFNKKAMWDKYTTQPNVDGVIYLEYSNHKALNGALKWSNNKPIVTPREMLWHGIAGSDVTSVVQHINAAPRNPKSATGYSLVLVHAWSSSMDEVKAVIDQLQGDVKVVTPDKMVKLIQNNVPKEDTEIANKVYEAETDFGHNTGKLDGDGWSANPQEHAAGHMLFGPGASDIPAGRNQVKFKTMIDRVTGDNDRVLNLDIYDDTAGVVVAEKAVHRSEFQSADTYHNSILEVDFVAGHSYQFRAWYDANAKVKIDRVTVVMNRNLAQRLYEAENDFGHNTGAIDGDGWLANIEQHGPGHMLYGPYVADLPSGVHDVTFRMKASGATLPDDTIAIIDINNASADQIIASKELKLQDFAVQDQYMDISLEDVDFSLGSTYEFRVHFEDKANVKVDHVRLDMPEITKPDAQSLYFKFGGSNVTSLAFGTDAGQKQLQLWGKASEQGKPDVNLTIDGTWTVAQGETSVTIGAGGALEVLQSGDAIVKASYNGLEAQIPIHVSGNYTNRIFEAERDFGHNTGAAAADGWYANPQDHAAGHMLHGPGVADLPSGSLKVDFRIKIDNPVGGSERVLNLDIYDGTGNKVTGEKAVLRSDFNAADTYQSIIMEADFVLGHAYQFRVWYDDNATVQIDNVSVRIPQ